MALHTCMPPHPAGGTGDLGGSFSTWSLRETSLGPFPEGLDLRSRGP